VQNVQPAELPQLAANDLVSIRRQVYGWSRIDPLVGIAATVLNVGALAIHVGLRLLAEVAGATLWLCGRDENDWKLGQALG